MSNIFTLLDNYKPKTDDIKIRDFNQLICEVDSVKNGKFLIKSLSDCLEDYDYNKISEELKSNHNIRISPSVVKAYKTSSTKIQSIQL